MKCIYCGKKINECEEEYEIHSCDGDFIHTKCKDGWNKHCERINNMTDEEFIRYMKGEID
ncbi:MAG: hypothetical protein HUJ59_04375 [Bacilli bacterium]|nr:hypothetical protein [Bacilli bacterium]